MSNVKPKPTIEGLSAMLDAANLSIQALEVRIRELETKASTFREGKAAPCKEEEVKIVFVENKKVFDADGNETNSFVKGESYVLPMSSAKHFVNRGLAVSESDALKNVKSRSVDPDTKKRIEVLNLYLSESERLGDLADPEQIKDAYHSLSDENQDKVDAELDD